MGSNTQRDHCTANHNSDEGWNLYGRPCIVTSTNYTATNSSYGASGDGNGFKLGSSGQRVPRTVTSGTSDNNKAAGYDGNGNTGPIITTGSGGAGNPTGLFARIYQPATGPRRP